MSIIRLFRFFFFITWLMGLSIGTVGCAEQSSLLTDTVRLAFKSEATDVTLGQTLNSNYRYLRLTTAGRVLLLVLGYVDQDPTTGDVVETWYSGQGEVLKLKNGRIIATTGMPFDWVAVRYQSLPSWDAALSSGMALQFARERDVKIRYQYGVSEQVLLKKVIQPSRALLAGSGRLGLVWFEESYAVKAYSTASVPPSLFAIDVSIPTANQSSLRVAYSRQCLAPDFCLDLQQWSPLDQAAAVAANRAGK